MCIRDSEYTLLEHAHPDVSRKIFYNAGNLALGKIYFTAEQRIILQESDVYKRQAVQAKTGKEAKVVKQLVVLHTNDTNSCVRPINPNLADTATANRGGFLRRVAMIRQERKANPDLLLFDSGDFSQGSPYSSLFQGDVEVGLMNEMKYHDATLGHHASCHKQ